MSLVPGKCCCGSLHCDKHSDMTTTVVYDMHSEHVTNYSHTTSVCTGSNPLSAAVLTVQEGLVRRVREVVKAAIHPSLTIVLHQKITSPLHQKRTAMELIAHPHSTNLPHIPTAHHTLTAQPSLTPSQHNPPSHPHSSLLLLSQKDALQRTPIKIFLSLHTSKV